jgi:DNA-binding transcriptional LysR family regulator
MLVAVVDAGSYSKAGEWLNVSHSAIHRQIRLLEDEVGDRILIRDGARRAKLTATGQILLNTSRRLQAELLAAKLQIRERKELQSGNLRIGTGTTMLVFFLPAVLDRFRKEYPGIEVQIVTGTADYVVEGIQTGKLDAGVILASSDMRPSGTSLVCEVLYRDEFVVAVSKHHPLSKEKSVPLKQLTEYPFITQSKSSHIRRVLERICAEAQITPKISMELENEEAMEPMIAIDMGIALISQRRAVKDRLHYLYITGQRIFCDVDLIFPDREYIQRSVKEFRRICRAVCKARPRR